MATGRNDERRTEQSTDSKHPEEASDPGKARVRPADGGAIAAEREVNEADWLESKQDLEGGIVADGPSESLGDRLGSADEADLLESAEPADTLGLAAELPLEAPEADVLDQRRPPSGDDEEDDRR